MTIGEFARRSGLSLKALRLYDARGLLQPVRVDPDSGYRHYDLGQAWQGGIFDTSYDRGATTSFPIGVGMVIAGWDQGLVGQQVGSRVLLSIPSHLGYGDRGVPQAGIKGGDTLVFVVDIVGVS